jgi:voltage-gated potassium channel
VQHPLPRLRWGLRQAVDPGAARVERHWRAPVVLTLVGTIPAFYAEMLDATPPLPAALAYVLAAAIVALALGHTALRSARTARHLGANPLDLLLIIGLLAAAALPPSMQSPGSLIVRVVVSMLTLVRMLWAMQFLVSRGGLAYLLLLSFSLLGLCGAGFWWLEPTVHSFGDGFRLAFTTAATVGYGDLVPTVAASRIFAIFVVLLGFGMVTMVTAAIAATWIETEERRIERQILHDLRKQIDSLRAEIVALRNESRSAARLAAEDRENASKRQPK